jgi:hypothetical protein
MGRTPDLKNCVGFEPRTPEEAQRLVDEIGPVGTLSLIDENIGRVRREVDLWASIIQFFLAHPVQTTEWSRFVAHGYGEVIESLDVPYQHAEALLQLFALTAAKGALEDVVRPLPSFVASPPAPLFDEAQPLT